MSLTISITFWPSGHHPLFLRQHARHVGLVATNQTRKAAPPGKQRWSSSRVCPDCLPFKPPAQRGFGPGAFSSDRWENRKNMGGPSGPHRHRLLRRSTGWGGYGFGFRKGSKHRLTSFTQPNLKPTQTRATHPQHMTRKATRTKPVSTHPRNKPKQKSDLQDP